MFKYLSVAVVMNLVYLVHARAQESALPPPSILKTDTGVGFIDLFLKAFPYLWSAFLGPIVIGYVSANAPNWIAKVPKAVLPVMSAVVGSLGGLMAGLGSLGMDGGGVAIDTGMVNGAATGATVQGAIQLAGPKLTPVILADEKKG